MLDTNVNRPDFAWLNESSRIFLHRGYLLEGTEPEDRIRYIADHAEKLLNYPGFADKFYHYMARGYYSLASPIWSNFGLDRGLPISCVTGDTWINTNNGGKQAKDIVVGDMVLTHKNRYRPVTKVIPTKDKGDIYRLKVSLEIDELYITGNHPVLTQEGWVKVEDLNIRKHMIAVNNEILKGDKDHVIDESTSVVNDGIEHYPILSLEKTDRVEDVYDFTVEEDHSFSCAGVIVHNCFGSFIGDSIYDIMNTTAEVGMMSKTGGGTSGYFGAIRPRGAPIKDNGHSDGSFNFAKLFDTVIDVISQGTSRKGQFAGYIDIEHPDIEEWLEIHKEGNPIQLMYYGVCIGDQWLKEMKEGDAEKRRIWAKVLQRKAESGIPYLFFKDNVNNQKPDVYKYKDMTIYASNLCAEIALPSSLEESFVCCLSSMNALYFDEWKDTDAVETMTYFLDAVMEEFIQKSKSMPMMEKAHRFASRHRAIGIGVLGWHSYLQYKHVPFESFQAMQLNNELFKTIQERSHAASREMAEKYGEPEILKGYGRRNTTTTCVAPTKSSSFILGGVSPSVEPIRSNYYIKDLAKIKTTYRNPLLTKVLQEKGLDNEATWQSILVNDGSVQHLEELSSEDKEVFKTWQEISQLTIIQQAAQRQKYIDQGQSINILVHPDTPTKDINQLYLTAHELGMKSIYYQFSMSAAQKFNRALLNTCTTCES